MKSNEKLIKGIKKIIITVGGSISSALVITGTLEAFTRKRAMKATIAENNRKSGEQI